VTDEPILPATLEGPAAAPYGRRRTYSDNTIALENLLYTLWRYKWVISGVVGAGLIATFLLINQLVPRYSTTAVLTLVTHQNDRDTTYLASIFGISSGQQFVEAQASVLRSPELISRVIKKLNLGDDPEFATWLRAEPKGIANLLTLVNLVVFDEGGRANRNRRQ
jgi:uncharacterized protein involved in exopolysaccharide biosynthesis